jgi:hypothetical protein
MLRTAYNTAKRSKQGKKTIEEQLATAWSSFAFSKLGTVGTPDETGVCGLTWKHTRQSHTTRFQY